MPGRCRCDTCKEIKMKSELTIITDKKGRPWGRCRDCVRKYGKRAYDLWYYASCLEFAPVVGGFEDPNKIVGFDPTDNRY